MTDILNAVAEQNGKFIPSKPSHYLAVQIAKKLSDADAVRHYLVLFEHYPEHILLESLRRCSAEGNLSGESFMRNFRELTHQNS